MREEMPFSEISIEECIAGTVVYPPGGTYGPRYYREIQLILLHSGSMEVDVDGTHYRVRPGQIMLLLPGQTVYIAFDLSCPSWHRWITASPKDYGSDMHNRLNGMPCVLPISEQMNRLVDLSVLQQRMDTPEHRNVQDALVLTAIRLYAAESLGSDAIIANPLIREVKTFIHENYSEPLSMREVAERLNVSVSHLARVFKENEGITLIQYLWHYRVEHSLVLLRTTGLSIGEIAEQCGFKSRYHYSRMVKSLTGKSAREIRTVHWRK